MNNIEKKIKKIIENTEYNDLIWIYDEDTGITKAEVGDRILELIDNRDTCEVCCCDFEDCGCGDDRVAGNVILTAYHTDIYQFDYYDISQNLLSELADVVFVSRLPLKRNLTQITNFDRESILDLFI